MTRELAFYLKGRPSGGGANSVVQEFTALVHNYGVGYLVVSAAHLSAFRLAYGWDERILSRVRTSLEELPENTIPVATTNDSVSEVRGAWKERGGTILYYVQDYEPLFYQPHSPQHTVALESYAHVNDVVAVVKTEWLKNALLRESMMPVVKIRPSINRSLYYPDGSRSTKGRRILIAMLRPATPRRAPHRTMAIVNRVAREMSQEVEVVVFGAPNAELESAGLTLHDNVLNAGRLRPSEVAELMRRSHYFLELSDYQAFGRSAAEGMAAGVVPISTMYGAPPEFIVHDRSGFLVDPSDLSGVFDSVAAALNTDEDRYRELSWNARGAVAAWSIDRTAADWLELASDLLG